MLKFLLEKEFKQIIRNSFIPKMIVMFPLMVLLVFPWAASFEIKNIKLSIIDNDHSPYSQRLIQKISSSGYFHLVDYSNNYDNSLVSVEKDKSDIIIEIPRYFERDLVANNEAGIMISANTVNGTKGGLGSYYIMGIVSDFSSEVRNEWLQLPRNSTIPTIEVVTQNLFNPYMDYKVFMIPALLVILLTLACGFLPALNIVAEKEAGTIEQLNVTPLPKLTFIFSKLLPYWIIGFIILGLALVIAYFMYGMIPAGRISTLFLFASIYALTMSGLGLVISNYSGTIQQAMFVMFFFIMILILMSGLFTPISSMPQWAQFITYINPLRYFIEVMRMLYLKGSGIIDMRMQLYALIAFGVFFNIWAVLSYQKKK